MSTLSRRILAAVAAVSILILLQGIAAGDPPEPGPSKVTVSGEFSFYLWHTTWGDSVFSIMGEGILDTGPVYWDPGDPDNWRTDNQIMVLDLRSPSDGKRISLNPDFISMGTTRQLAPPDDFPAESFFDVFVQVELPGEPGELYVNLEPIHLTSVVEQWPPYFATYEYPDELPPLTLYNHMGDPVGEMYWCRLEMRPWYGPAPHIHVETSYRSNVAVIRDGLVNMTGSVSGRVYEGYPYEFAYRTDLTAPFIIISDGYRDPLNYGYSTHGLLDLDADIDEHFGPGSDPFEGQVAEFRMGADIFPYGWLYDTVQVYMDGVPPIPEFADIPRDSVGYFQVDSFFDITYKLDDELTGPGNAELWVFPLQEEYHRDLTSVNQLGMGTEYDSTSCAPAAAACCLKYFADHGHSNLDNPRGDEAKPDQTGEEMARELQDAMGTDSLGTTPDEMVSGIEEYLDSHGKQGWTVEHGEVNDPSDLAEMFREFESDGEDVLLILQDTTAAGDTIGHVVTLGSKRATYVEKAGPPPSGEPAGGLDFMDPWGGGSTADNNYDVGGNDEGRQTTVGYDLDGAGGDAWIAGYIKVSPPDGAAASAARPVQQSPSYGPGWLLVSAGIANGNGVVDTLQWDTHGFPGGLYLMEVVTTDDQGITCTDIRLAGIPAYTVGDDDVPGIKTMLRGSYPNPFNPTTTIEFSLAKGTRVTLAVYDVMGRRIRLLLDREFMPEGVHKIAWDGRTDSGRQAASGVYFCRFTAEKQVEARKLILLR